MKRRKISKKPLFVALAVLLVVGAAAFFFTRDDNSENDSIATSAAKNPNINYGPPTDEEKQQAETRKEEIIKQNKDQDQSTGSDGKKQVTVTITSDTNPTGPDVTIAGFVQGVVEEGGACTVVLTKGSERKTDTSKSFADVSTTNCSPITVQLGPGNWQLILSYSSSSSTGSSTKTLTVK